MVSHQLITGFEHTDHRGRLISFNEFDMSGVKRFYEIIPSSTEVIRAWQAHQQESKWFYCNRGSFLVNLVKIDTFTNPSGSLMPGQYLLRADRPSILEIPGGFANGFRALVDNSSLMVFSNFTLDQSENDDFRFPLNTWKADWN